MTRYFDAHLYFANWGSSAFMLRLPLSALDKTILAEFVQPTLSDAGSGFENALELITTAEHRVLAWRFNDDSGYCDRFCDEEGAEWLDRQLPLRDELLGGDSRPLYLGWLARVCAGELGDEDVEPPLPAGLASLTSAQQALVEYCNWIWIGWLPPPRPARHYKIPLSKRRLLRSGWPSKRRRCSEPVWRCCRRGGLKRHNKG
jgi:hypothetical protein